MAQQQCIISSVCCPALPQEHKLANDCSGFSLVEVVIAMLLLAILSVALLPLIISVTVASSQNRDYLQATGYARAILTEAQSLAPSVPGHSSSCAAIRQDLLLLGGEAQPDPVSGFIAEPTVSPCPASFPGTLTLNVKVFELGSGGGLEELAELSTVLRVGAA